MVVHLVEIDVQTGRVVAEWKSEETHGRPTAPPGRELVDVTANQYELGALVARRASLVDGALVVPELPPAALDLRTFLRLFTRAEIMAIGAQRDADPDISYFWTMLTVGQTVDLGHAETDSGLNLLISKGLLTPARKQAILARQPPP